VESHRKASLKYKALKTLRNYQLRKAKEDKDFSIARKFRFVTLLQKSIISIKNVRYQRIRKAHI
jgi:hypothetical protein